VEILRERLTNACLKYKLLSHYCCNQVYFIITRINW